MLHYIHKGRAHVALFHVMNLAITSYKGNNPRSECIHTANHVLNGFRTLLLLLQILHALVL